MQTSPNRLTRWQVRVEVNMVKVKQLIKYTSAIVVGTKVVMKKNLVLNKHSQWPGDKKSLAPGRCEAAKMDLADCRLEMLLHRKAPPS